ncbi:MAG: Cys-tRNA(Pro) deacylase [Peptococcaceae bacterium]|nr:Cys-tRNA(Pro) deacylase [Peptococcaceae bacterium]
MKAKKTNAARLLDSPSVPYELIEYQADENDLSARHVAEATGQPLERIFKTLVAKGDKHGILVACIPGGRELDLKALAQESGNKKVELVPMKDILGLTGYIRGGCSPLAMKKSYPTYIDASAQSFDRIIVSAGQRGLQLVLSPQALASAAGGRFCAVSIEEG